MVVPLFFVALGFVVTTSIFVLRWYANGSLAKFVQVTRRDLLGLSLLVKIRYRFWKASKANEGINEIFLRTVSKNRDKIAVFDISLNKSTTFEELNRLACQYANLLKNNGVTNRDVVAIMMDNGVNFVAAWLGAAKLGAVSAWINTNLKEEALAHSLDVVKAKFIICDCYYEKRIAECPTNQKSIIFSHSDHLCTSPLGLINEFPDTEPIAAAKATFRDPLCYIYTSGTTGLPKAAVIKHYRYFYVATASIAAFGVKPSKDVLYLCLPMYHTSAGVLGIGQTVVYGQTVVIRKKFSASNFWKDCCKYDCTISQYIGELLRYILLAPPCEEEAQHSVRLLIGNGLRPAIWREFQKRFKIRQIGEFYGSTEGTSNLVNIDGKEGSCGFMPTIKCFHRLYPVRLLKVEEDTGELIRNEKGYCIPVKPGQSGALACAIRKNNLLLNFEGYMDKAETARKIIENPFPGTDAMFLSGDILYWDRMGYFYFKDRIGDTFRWKGENVSTTEVETTLQKHKEIVDACVFGVEIPECEGRAGMASILPSPKADLKDLLKDIAEKFSKSLPPYAIPVFIRILTADIDKTGTFKIKKREQQRLSFNPQESSSVYVFDRENNDYKPLTPEYQQKIMASEVKF
ncbi:unnamed protein product [Caenorhabditis auriculariae]|uniref:Long-chain-fatty-acid--CoA ligase n=1 Tax=Caenorhabditis auriculariae TaxID=2777116 RepID=A0A8S1HEP2_9PELO|nr:unnamed protein product [Caenorhabditis auriculariae]